MEARGDVQGLLGNDWRMNSELARTTQITVRPTLPTPQEFVHLTDAEETPTSTEARLNKEEKAAQRGLAVAAAYLQAALAKHGGCEESWLEPNDETWVIDFHPWVGDRAIATLNLSLIHISEPTRPY